MWVTASFVVITPHPGILITADFFAMSATRMYQEMKGTKKKINKVNKGKCVEG
jgi:hypothetical protein